MIDCFEKERTAKMVATKYNKNNELERKINKNWKDWMEEEHYTAEKIDF